MRGVQEDQTLTFGRYRFNPRFGLWRGREEVRLAPRTLSLLRVFLERPGEVVTKDELFSSVWSGTVVSDAALATCVQDLRHALRDDARQPRYVETLHRRGYRFLPAPSPMSVSAQRSSTGHGSRGSAPPRSPLPIGRASELEVLRTAFDRARLGTRRIVFVTGEAGIGKTTLVDAFVARHVEAGRILVARGQCIERYGVGEAYLPVFDALGRLCRQEHKGRVIAALARHAPTWLAQLPVPTPAGSRGARRPQAASPERMLLEVTQAMEALAADTPLVLWLEDLHWADPSTLDWLAFLARRPEPARLMVIATVRAAELMIDASPLRAVTSELVAHRLCQELLVGHLTEAATEEYLGSRFDLAPGTEELGRLSRALHTRTSGNPLFMVNAVDDLVARDVITRCGAVWEVHLPSGPILTGVPEHVRALIERQLDRLDGPERELLEVASLAGMTFSVVAVAAGLGQDPSEIGTRCATLTRRGLVLGPGVAERWPDGTITDRYTFRHELYREVLYRRLPVDRRTALHARVGQRLEAGYAARAAEIAGELAMHFDGARDTERTLLYLQHAGWNAVTRNAPREALEHLKRALALVPAPGEGAALLPPELAVHAVDVRLALRPVLSLLGEGWRALPLLRDADRIASGLGDETRRGRVLAFTTTMHAVLGQVDDAVAVGARALSIARRRSDLELRIVAVGALVQARYFRGDHARVVRLARGNLTALPSEWTYGCFGGVSPVGTYNRYFLVQSLAEIGRFEEAARHSAEAIRIAGETDHATGVGGAYYAAAMLDVLRGEWTAAGPTIERAVTAFRRGDVALHFPWALACSAWILARLGEFEDAATRLADAERLLHRHAARGVVLAQSWAFHALGRAALLLDRVDEARRLAEHALEAAISNPGYAAHVAHLLGDIAARADSLGAPRAEAHYREARNRALALGMRPLVARCHLGLGMLYRRLGRHREAGRSLAHAAAMSRILGIPAAT